MRPCKLLPLTAGIAVLAAVSFVAASPASQAKAQATLIYLNPAGRVRQLGRRGPGVRCRLPGGQ